ncbi:DUF1161 domain-containing protein [Rhizobacter sp. AJA081-3]|jgi:hypothetical protein|uniref:DUF1161 domain-containing protein n=1 Tax=Rhizobacter sp. AJA081-3 TaxID=2753607 RepID=UPI001ADF38CE|nr:DUF1161 domain-containing protein [Rhizobacter sp. AJA081-3]QTN21604.1 DUF1161 domain-containing protein [Rhizobacter sp. AJA081-3]
MTRFALALIAPLLALAAPAGAADTCEAIQARIDAKIRASGVQSFTLRTVDAAAKVEGKVVGSCDLGTKKIVYAQGGAAARPGKDAILTECKDGTVSLGGDCRKQP